MVAVLAAFTAKLDMATMAGVFASVNKQTRYAHGALHLYSSDAMARSRIVKCSEELRANEQRRRKQRRQCGHRIEQQVQLLAVISVTVMWMSASQIRRFIQFISVEFGLQHCNDSHQPNTVHRSCKTSL